MKVTYVLVTYNRLELLKQTLKAALEMTRKFDNIIVIDNCSTDGTSEYLKSFLCENKNIKFFSLAENIGGAGGFSFGIQKALETTDCDWVFLADDDAVPDADVLEILEKTYDNECNKSEIAALCTSVLTDGQIQTIHRRIIRKGLLNVKEEAVSIDNYNTHFDVDILSFVGAMIKVDVIKKIGLPQKELFIYYDDSIYSMRIRGEGRIICEPKAVMDHRVSNKTTNWMDWREYYMTRNKIYFLKELFKPRYYKWCVLKQYLKRTTIVARILKKRSKKDIKMLRAALYDGSHGKLGINPIYRPK